MRSGADGAALMPTSVAETRKARVALLVILLLAAATKLAVLATIGPWFQFDSGGYEAVADAIRRGMAFHPFDFSASALPNLIFRPIGYPAVLAGAQLLSATHWPSIVVIAQGVSTLLIGGMIFVVLRRVFAAIAVPAIVTVLYLFSGSLLLDNTILSDSLYSSLFTFVLFALIGDLVGCWTCGLLAIAGLGVLWGASLLFRDSGLYFIYLPLVLLGLRSWRNKDWARGGAAIACFGIVVAAIIGLYVAGNWHRTGIAFFSITGVANWLRPVFDIAQFHYADPFQGSDAISAVMRGRPQVYDFPAQLQFLDALHAQCNCTPVDLNRIAFHKYLVTVLQHPFAYLAVVWHNFNYLGLGSLLADPAATINQFVQLGSPIGHRIIPGLSIRNLVALRADFSVVTLLLMVVATISTTVSTVLFSAFVFVIPYSAVRAWRDRLVVDTPLVVAGFAWFGFMSFSLAFSMVHYEARHALPVLPLGMTGIGYIIWCAEQRRQNGMAWSNIFMVPARPRR